MGNKKFNLTKLALALGVTLSLSGCFSDNDNNIDIKPPVPEPDEQITVPKPDTPAALNFFVNTTFLDAVANDGTLVSDVTVKFFDSEGAPSESIANLEGEATAEFMVTDGSVSFKLVENADISSVTMIASAEGYFDSSAVVDLSNTDEAIKTIVTLAKTEALVVASDTATADGGVLSADLTATAADEDADANVSVVIASGVELRDADGEVIEETDISMSVVTAGFAENDDKVSAAAVIPQGLQEKAGNEAGETSNPLAFVEVKVNAGDTPVKNFDPGLDITTKIAGTFEGTESFDVMTYDETTGVWSKEEGKATFVSDSKDTVKFTVNHLSSFVPVETVTGCSEEVSFAFTGDAVPASGLNMRITSSALDKSKIVNSASGVLYAQGTAGAAGISSTATVNVQVSDANGNVWGTANNVALCNSSATAADIAIELDAPVTYVDQDFSLTYTCSNTDQPNNQLAFTGALVRYNQEGKAPLIAAETNGTYALTGLVSGATYEVSVIPVGVDVGDASLTVPNFTAAAGEAVSFNVGRSNCATEQQTVTGTGGS